MFGRSPPRDTPTAPELLSELNLLFKSNNFAYEKPALQVHRPVTRLTVLPGVSSSELNLLFKSLLVDVESLTVSCELMAPGKTVNLVTGRGT